MPAVKSYKLKVSGDPKLDVARLRAVLEARPDVDIWIDANQSYRPLHLETFCKQVEDIPQVRSLEQPVKRVDRGRHRARRIHSPVLDYGTSAPELNGPKFLEDLFLTGLNIKENVVRVPDSPGLGVQMNVSFR